MIRDLPAEGGLPPALLDLNNAHAEELSFLTPGKAADLVRMAFMAAHVGEADVLLLAFDQDAPYDNANFRWFKTRFDHFVYIDRVVVARAARGRGLARMLYRELFARAGRTRVVCEVNEQPPNPASDAFHQALGFAVVGAAVLPDSGKSVRYYCRETA